MIFDLEGARRREVQAIGAAISTRSWHDAETAYNALRDKMDAVLHQPAPPAALSPQTLPAPGEVAPDGAMLICDQTGGRMWTCWPVPHLKKEAAESIYGDRGGYRTVPLYAAPSLATVAAANVDPNVTNSYGKSDATRKDAP